MMHQGKKREQKFAGTRQILTTLKLPAPRCRSSPNHDFYWFVSLILACCKASVANHLASDCEQNWDTCWAVELICPDKTIALSLCDEKNENCSQASSEVNHREALAARKFGALRKLSPELIRTGARVQSFWCYIKVWLERVLVFINETFFSGVAFGNGTSKLSHFKQRTKITRLREKWNC